ncbi:DUF6082 family protein [Streptomyces sp. NPDC051636]|uniref:DUF6082 family protein n=1 Tax=Streptomyces sp. NPDC051636 TaxID=3365663 RepID=UPI0037B703B1
METDPARGRAAALITWPVTGTAAIAAVCLASIAISSRLTDGVERMNANRRSAVERSALGEYFGGVSAVFSGLALLLLVVTLFCQRELRFQRQELAHQRQELIASRDELRRSATSDMRSLHVQLTQMAMNDETLADGWGGFPDEARSGRRQMLLRTSPSATSFSLRAGEASWRVSC